MKPQLKVGGTIWNSSGKPKKIIGETKLSWLIEKDVQWEADVKVNKKNPNRGRAQRWPHWFLTEEEAMDTIFLQTHNYAISKAVEWVEDPKILRTIADLIGWKEPEAKVRK